MVHCPVLVALVGLGVAIDYSLLVVTRWREEGAHGRANDDAAVAAIAHADRAMLLSGVTVATRRESDDGPGVSEQASPGWHCRPAD